MKNLTLENIARVCSGKFYGPEELRKEEITSITTDSRKAEPGCLFVAIKGERVDGHDFAAGVMEQGALCVLAEHELPDFTGCYIQVESTLAAVREIAEFYRKGLDIKVVGITGSVGKTSTKEAIASVLAQKYCVLKTQGNFNNELGLPLTVFRLNESHQVAVLEMGISDFGEMHRLAEIARPDICVITNIGQCHLENLRDRDGVCRAKTEMFDHMNPGGTVILNGDDDKLSAIRQVQGKEPVFFGLGRECSVYGDEIRPLGLKGVSCVIHMDGRSCPVTIPIPGKHMVSNALAAAAVGRVLGLSVEQIREGLEKLQPVGGRFRLIETDKMTIVDDCYNANPVSVKASLDVLSCAQGRKVAILGDMFELGERENALHESVGSHAAQVGVDLLICVGARSRHTAEGAEKTSGCGQVMRVDTLDELFEKLPGLLQKGDTVLVKASHGMHFEKVIEKLVMVQQS